MTTEVFVRLRFEGMHCWPDAPDAVGFLRTPHRHEFHVELHVPVRHDDRDVEFLLLKQAVLRFIASVQSTHDTATWSCERWAGELLARFNASRVMVSEDGENGAWVYA